MKTNVKLKVNGEEYYRVKLDSNKFPYIVIYNEKVIINSTKFPRSIWLYYGLLELTLDIISGKEELEEILANPELTIDKLSLKQQMRVG